MATERTEYPGKPIPLGDVQDCLKESTLSFLPRKKSLQPARVQLPGSRPIVIPADRQYPIVKDTIDGFKLDLAPGSSLADKFLTELKQPYDAAVETFSPLQKLIFGKLFLYPHTQELAAYAPPFWHYTALLTRNSLLIRDPEQMIGLQDREEIFRKIVVASAGASVGKNAWLLALDTLNPLAAKIGDPRSYKTTNARRTRVTYRDIGKNKAVAASLQAHEIDPYLSIHVYPEGIDDTNIDEFVAGNTTSGEPAADFIIEETDNPLAKVKLREKCREHKKILIMISDIGPSYQIDIRNWRDHPNLPLTVWTSDDKLYSAQSAFLKEPSRDKFLDFAWSLIGNNWQLVPEFRDLILEKLKSQFTGGIPQLGIASYAGGAEAALDIALMALGYKRPESTFVDSRQHKIITKGEEL